MELRTSSFCSLARSSDWQVFLNDIASDLCASLKDTIKNGKGCRANSNKMMDIYHELEKRGLKSDLEVFLKRRFPWIIKSDDAPTRHQVKQAIQQAQSIKIKEKVTRDWNSLNKHQVFKLYRPDVLAFPQKLILMGNPDTLYNNVQDFIKDKLAVDYIIIEDRAYIEYFDTKYSSVVDRIPRHTREIYQYRQKLSQQ